MSRFLCTGEGDNEEGAPLANVSVTFCTSLESKEVEWDLCKGLTGAEKSLEGVLGGAAVKEGGRGGLDADFFACFRFVSSVLVG